MHKNPFEKIPHGFLKKWQEIADLIAGIMNVPAALIMKTENEFMEVFTSSKNENNPYKVGDKELMHGLYCETVIKTQKKLRIPNALKDKNWSKNSDIKPGMIAYLGYPINFPDQKPFGTLCVQDNKKRDFSTENERLLLQFKKVLELDLALIFSLELKENYSHADIIQKLSQDNKELRTTNEELKKTREAVINSAEKLKHSHDLMNYIIKYNRSAVAVHDKDLRYIYVSQRYIDDFKVKESDVIGKHHYDVFPDLPQKWREVYQKALAGEVCGAEEDPFYREDGSVDWTCWECRPWHESDGSIGGIIIYTEVINKRKQAQEKIHQAHETYLGIINSVAESIYIQDEDGVFLEVNNAAANSYGLKREELIGQTPEILSADGKNDLPLVAEMIKKALNGEPQRFEFWGKGADETVFPSEVTLTKGVYFGKKVIVAVARNINERKQAEENIRQSQQLLQSISDNMLDLVALTDLEGNYSFAGASHKILGYETDELIGTNVMEYVHPDDLPVVMTAFKEFLNNKEENKRIIYRNRCADGSYLWFETVGRFICDENGDPQQILFNTRDITDRRKADEALRESEEKYRTLFETMNEGVFYQTKDGKLIDINQKGLDLLGLSEDELIGRTSSHPEWKVIDSQGTILPPEKHPSMIALSTKKPFLNQEIGVFNPKTNRYTWLLVNAVPQFRPNEDEPHQVFVTMSDITGLKLSEEHLKERNAFIQTILDNLPIGVALNNFNEGQATYMNEKFKEIYGWDEEDIVNIATFFEKVYPDKNYREKLIEQIMADIQSGDPERMRWENLTVTRKDGTHRVINAANIPLIGQNTMVSTVMDVTREKQAEQVRKELEIAHKTAQFKQNFLAKMSHEIRTPLTGVLGMIEVLEQTPLAEEQQDYIKDIRISGENLREIINQVLDYSKIEAGKIDLNPVVFEFTSLLESAKKLFKDSMNASVQFFVEIDPQISPFISADKFRLSQVVNNFVSNAIKFTQQGSVTLRASLVRADKASKKVVIKIEAQDTGKGIPESLQKKLFTPFVQSEEGQKNEYEGTGLGLSISKELVKLFGGEIGVLSKEGSGSTFWFTFQVEEAESIIKENILQSPNKANKKLNILIAEDTIVVQKVVSLLLKSLGHQVFLVNNGQQALDVIEPGKFDLILMDLQMPVMDGITATKLLKEKYDDLPPIVCLSANAFEGDREKYMALGMDEYLTKPVKKEDFEKLIRNLIV